MSESKYNCPVDAAICKIGGKYKAVILYHLKSETLRYNEIKRKIKRITDKMLAQQLRELESDGLVKRRVYAVVPPKTEYSLTPLGMTLSPILDALCQWGEQFMEETEEQELELTLKDEEWPFEYTDHDRDVVRAIVYDEEGFLYFVKAVRDDEFGKATIIETSGGGVEKNEDFICAIKRELKEELGVSVEVEAKIGTVSDYYNLIHRHNLNNYYLCKVTGFGENSLTEEEKNQFHLSTLKLTYDEAVKLYEKNLETKLGRLITNRELPVLKKAKEMLDERGINHA